LGGEHNYVSFDINTPAGLSQLDIPGVSVKNGQANFTISFEPSNQRAPLNSNLVMELNADLSDAQNYGGSKGHEDINSQSYAKLADEMYILGSIISSEKNKYNFWPGVYPGGGYNSNSALYTMATLSGQGAAYNQLQQRLTAGGIIFGGKPLGNVSIPIENSANAFGGGRYGTPGTTYTNFESGNTHTACGTLCK